MYYALQELWDHIKWFTWMLFVGTVLLSIGGIWAWVIFWIVDKFIK